MQQRCIIVVEDEPLIRMDAVSMLEEAGLSVVDFARADEALAYVTSHRKTVAAVFTDINVIGKLSGLDLAISVARLEPGVRIVVTSGRFNEAPREMPAGASFVQKPWLPLQVIQAMQTAVEA